MPASQIADQNPLVLSFRAEREICFLRRPGKEQISGRFAPRNEKARRGKPRGHTSNRAGVRE